MPCARWPPLGPFSNERTRTIIAVPGPGPAAPAVSDFFGLEYDRERVWGPDTYIRNVHACFAMMKPVPCPYRLIRIGGHEDGAYLVPDDLANVRACFSPGVSNHKDFEGAE